jgi:serine/threonine protein kinase
LEGLDHLHSQNIIYRDVKPDNLLISAHPRMKLADFGNVHFLPDTETVIRGLEGTTSYMSPEMRMGRFYNTKTDIWSLGITLLNVLFDNDTTFPNFDVTGPWGARKFAAEQDYLSFELEDFMQSLFLKSGDRPTAKQLLQHPFVRKADKRAFKSLFQQFPQQNLALPVLSQRFKPDTPPPTPEQQSVTPPESQYQVMKEDSCPDICVTNLTPPVTPSPDPQEKIFLKLVFKKDNAMEKTILDCIKARRTHGCENREFKYIIEDNLMRGAV